MLHLAALERILCDSTQDLARLIRLDSGISLFISAIIIKNSKGPNTVPCGTPLSTGESALIPPGSLTKS